VQFWQHTGQIIFIAGLQAIPKALRGREDGGANRWQTFRYVTWPLLAPAAAIVIAYTTVQSFKAFDLILALDGGPLTRRRSSPGSTTAFRYDFGYASAGAVVFMLILAALTAIQFRVLRVVDS